MSFINKLIPKFLRESINYFRKNGFKKTLKKLGWKMIFLIVLYYLIRDSILYIIIPYFVGKKLNYF